MHGPDRCQTYRGADAFIICIASNDPVSFEHVEKWKLEIQLVENRKPIFLIQTKKDLEASTEKYEFIDI